MFVCDHRSMHSFAKIRAHIGGALSALRQGYGSSHSTNHNNTTRRAHKPSRECNITPYSRNTLSLSCLHTKMTTTLIPIPDDAYEAIFYFLSRRQSPCRAASLKDTGHWSTQFTQKLEASFHRKTAQSRLRNMNADYGKVRSRAELHHHKTQTA